MSPKVEARSLGQVLSIAVLPAIFMLPIVALLMLQISAIRSSAASEERLDLIINRIHTVHEHLIGMESSLRGYLLTSDASFLEPFSAGDAPIREAIASLEVQVNAEPGLALRLRGLTTHYEDWVGDARRSIAARMSGKPFDVRRSSTIDKTKMDALLADVAWFNGIQSERRDAIIDNSEYSVRFEILGVVLMTLLAVAAVGYAVRRVLHLTQVQQRAEIEQLRLAEARERATFLEEENRRIQTADQMKSEFVTNMSHELRTPLTAMIGFAEILRDEKAGPLTAKQRQYVDYVLSGGRHLVELIGDVLDLAKVEAGRIEVTLVEVHLPGIVRDTADALRELASQKGIDLHIDVSRGPARVLTDPKRLRQILYNYISNAVKFTPAGGHVEIVAEAEGDEGFRVAVSDDGLGIPAEDMASLFEKFSRLEAGPEPGQAGTGLGLALSKRIAEALGGTTGVWSVRGQGSTFFATFPNGAPKAVRKAARKAGTLRSA